MPLKIKFLTILDNLNLVSITNNTLIQLRVQGEKVKGQGQFDGGTPMPRYCPIAMTNGQEEMHLRALSPTSSPVLIMIRIINMIMLANTIVCFPPSSKI